MPVTPVQHGRWEPQQAPRGLWEIYITFGRQETGNRNEIVDALPVPRDCPVRPLSTITVIVIHTDRRQARNSRVFRTLPQSVQDAITSRGWDHAPPANDACSIAAAPANGSMSIIVEYQAECGAKPPTIERLSVVNEKFMRANDVSRHGIM